MFFLLLYSAAFTLLLHLSTCGQGRKRIRDASTNGFCAVQSILSPYHPPHYSARR
ncbi:hypothetical protein SOVF_201020 [Spinacia oleracea]|nr:hypothetical protein SOVF_201020 [Spinacia oleracea]